MKLPAAQELALRLMHKHKLKGWSFSLFKSTATVGRMNYRHRLISVNEKFISANPASIVKDVILHEIVHALLAKKDQGIRVESIHEKECRDYTAHDKRFKAKAKKLGCSMQCANY